MKWTLRRVKRYETHITRMNHKSFDDCIRIKKKLKEEEEEKKLNDH